MQQKVNIIAIRSINRLKFGARRNSFIFLSYLKTCCTYTKSSNMTKFVSPVRSYFSKQIIRIFYDHRLQYITEVIKGKPVEIDDRAQSHVILRGAVH